MVINPLSLFQRVVALSGLSMVIAPSAMERALVRAGVESSRLTSRDLGRALPSIERSLQVYLPASRVAERMEALRRLTVVPEPASPLD